MTHEETVENLQTISNFLAAYEALTSIEEIMLGDDRSQEALLQEVVKSKDEMNEMFDGLIEELVR